jgi:hypothetical protein
MPGGSKKAADAALVVHLASGVSPAGAAKLAGVSEATCYRRLADPTFRQRVDTARASFWERALGILSKGAAESATVLRRLLPNCKPPRCCWNRGSKSATSWTLPSASPPSKK